MVNEDKIDWEGKVAGLNNVVNDYWKDAMQDLEKLGGKNIVVQLVDGQMWEGKMIRYNPMQLTLYREKENEELNILFDMVDRIKVLWDE